MISVYKTYFDFVPFLRIIFHITRSCYSSFLNFKGIKFIEYFKRNINMYKM